jgi:hypothetical protein
MRGNFLSIRSLFVIAATALALLLAAGCGDSGSDSATGSSGDTTGSSTTGSSGNTTEITVDTGSLSKAAFIKKVEPICRKAMEKFQTRLQAVYEESRDNPRKPTELSLEEEYFETDFAETFEEMIDRISALGAPQGDEQEIATYLEGVQNGIGEAAEDHEAFSQAFLEARGSFKETPQVTVPYGLNGCP